MSEGLVGRVDDTYLKCGYSRPESYTRILCFISEDFAPFCTFSDVRVMPIPSTVMSVCKLSETSFINSIPSTQLSQSSSEPVTPRRQRRHKQYGWPRNITTLLTHCITLPGHVTPKCQPINRDSADTHYTSWFSLLYPINTIFTHDTQKRNHTSQEGVDPAENYKVKEQKKKYCVCVGLYFVSLNGFLGLASLTSPNGLK